MKRTKKRISTEGGRNLKKKDRGGKCPGKVPGAVERGEEATAKAVMVPKKAFGKGGKTGGKDVGRIIAVGKLQQKGAAWLDRNIESRGGGG